MTLIQRAVRPMIMALAVIMMVMVTGCGLMPGPQSTPSPPGRTGSETGSTGGLEDVPGIVTEIETSVVTIRTSGGQGSGVVYKSDGTIVTSGHVIEDDQGRPAGRIEVLFADGQRSAATVVAIDNVSDIGVIKAERQNLPVPEYATSPPRIGQLAVVVGSPLGLTETVTAGIVSGLNREMPPTKENPQGLFDLIQTDAAISPGNSGGAVVNDDAVVIGLAEAYLPPQSGAVSIGFVTPAAVITKVADQLIATGEATYAYLGIRPANVTPQIADRYDLPVSQGALVADVTAGSPAADAGLRPGDIITVIAATNVRTVTDLLSVLRDHEPGAKIEITLNRAGETNTVTAMLGRRP